jgi:hypothetical protein
LAAGVFLVVGKRRPLLGGLAAVGVLVAAAVGYLALLALAWPM